MKPLVYKKSRRVRGTKPVRHKMHFAKGDTVRVIAGEALPINSHPAGRTTTLRLIPSGRSNTSRPSFT